MPQSRSTRRAGRIALAILACLALAPAAALAAKTITVHYTVTVKPHKLAEGRTVKAKAVVSSPESKVKQWWSKKAVAKVVRKGVNGGYQSPYMSEGYRCSPVVHGKKTSFTCRLQGADVPTSIKLTYTVVYRGDTRSG